jgi:hypothetical protein
MTFPPANLCARAVNEVAGPVDQEVIAETPKPGRLRMNFHLFHIVAALADLDDCDLRR